MATTTCYLQIEPEWSPYRGQEDKLWNIKAKRVTKGKPSNPIPGSVVIKLTLNIPDAAFMPLAPEATIMVPLDHTMSVVESTPIEMVE